VLPKSLHASRHKNGLHQRAAEAHLRDSAIGHGKSPEIAVGAAYECPVQRELAIAVGGKCRALQFLHGLANFNRRGSRRKPFAKAHRYGIRNASRHFPQKAVTLKTEYAAPYSVQVDWNNRRVHALDDSFHAAAERKQLAG